MGGTDQARWRVRADGVEEAGALAEERAVVLACQRGETAAFARLVRLHQDIALRTAYLLTNDREGAEDVAQVAFLQAFRAIGRFVVERPFGRWLLCLVEN
jgi:RNA polymerase sigma-70 factor (ECF subfamily)